MTVTRDNIYQFLQFCDRHIQGKERSDAQTFLNEFFKAFGHESAVKAGARFELPIPKASAKGHTGYADLWWPRDNLATLLIEMKSRGENLNRHYGQAWDYCTQLNPQPQYVILCNFDEFWIYDFEIQIDTPLDKIRRVDLPERLEAFRFMEFTMEAPKFQNNQVEITQTAAKYMGKFYQLLKVRSHKANFNAAIAQKFTLQCVMAMFAEDTKLLENSLFSQCLEDCLAGKSSFDLLNDGLFRRMNMIKNPVGRFKGVEYFNGGLFAEVYPIELNKEELDYLKLAANQDWSKVRPAIFGSIFESTVNEGERHQGGIHFTSENDIMKIIRPTISRYWEEKIEAINDLKALEQLKIEMRNYRVLDPACGSGNFLYMAYQELKQAEHLLLQKSAELRKTEQLEMSFVTPLQFYGIDYNPFAVELARVTLLIARKVAIDKLRLTENALPLDSLDNNIIKGDALLIDWPQANAIVGNPPFQSKNKMQQEFGAKYVSQIREKYPEIPGRADYCVYWFYKAHQQLPEKGCAGLVGTNTIRQNYSREGGLDYIVKHNGTITEAVSTQVWSGDAVVHVSIVNWVKGEKAGKKKLSMQLGDHKESPWQVWELDYINSSLSAQIDVSQAKKILINAASKCCYQGQTHGHEDFLLTPDQYLEFVQQYILNQEVIFPYLTGDDLVSTYPPCPKRYIIDFHPRDLKQASQYKSLFKRVKDRILIAREQAANEEEKRNQELLKINPKARVNRHHKNFLAKWWLLSYPRSELIEKLNKIPRYIGCSRVSKRPIFEFISAKIRPSDVVQVFPFADDYSFGILQSKFHWQWFTERCSTLGSGFRYTSDTVFDTFPFPQSPTLAQVQQVAESSVNLRQTRREIMTKNQWSLRELYRNLTNDPQNFDIQAVQLAQEQLDQAVAIAYGMDGQGNPLAFLLNLNLAVADKEAKGDQVTAPGLPDFIHNPKDFISQDCVCI
jgi:hypothetical protein